MRKPRWIQNMETRQDNTRREFELRSIIRECADPRRNDVDSRFPTLKLWYDLDQHRVTMLIVETLQTTYHTAGQLYQEWLQVWTEQNESK